MPWVTTLELAERVPTDVAETIDVRVVRVTWHVDGILEYELAPIAGTTLPAFEPGAHVDLKLTPDLTRSYSLVGDGSDRTRYRIAVQREADGRGGSRRIHETLRPGDRLTISAPRNAFPFAETARDVVLIGGGIGITPLIGMAMRRETLGLSYAFHYGTRSRERTPFVDWLLAEGRDVALVHSEGPGGQNLDLDAIVAAAPAGAHFYCCGPAVMIDRFLEAASGLPVDQVHIERFSAAPPPDLAEGLQVSLPSRAIDVTVKPGQTILAALDEAGARIPFACENGICGTCEMRVLEGEPEHRDQLLTPEEQAANQTVMVCCAGARSKRLVLDYMD